MSGFGAASPAPGGSGPAVDQTARNAAASAESIATSAVAQAVAAQAAADEAAGIGDAAQIAAEAAQATAESAHSGSANDSTARAAAAAADGKAVAAQAALSGSAHDSTARASASAAASAAATADGKAVAAQAALSGSANDSTARAAAAAAQSGSGNDSTARAAAAAAQADADALESLIALRGSRKRVYRSTAKSLSGTVDEVIGTNTLSYATGVFVGSEAEVSRITIPAGVSKVRVRVNVYMGGTTSGFRHAFGYWYNAAGTVIKSDRAFGKVAVAGTNTPTPVGGISPIISVTPGDYFVLFAQSSVSGGALSGAAPENDMINFIEVEVVA